MIDYNQTMQEIMTATRQLPPHLTEIQDYRLNCESMLITRNKLPKGNYYILDYENCFLNIVTYLVNHGYIPLTLDTQKIHLYNKARIRNDKQVAKKLFYSRKTYNQFTSFNNMFKEELTLYEECEIWDMVFNRLSNVMTFISYKETMIGNPPQKKSLDGIYFKKKPKYGDSRFKLTEYEVK